MAIGLGRECRDHLPPGGAQGWGRLAMWRGGRKRKSRRMTAFSCESGEAFFGHFLNTMVFGRGERI